MSPGETELSQSGDALVLLPCSKQVIPPTNQLGYDCGAEELCPGKHGLSAATPGRYSHQQGLWLVLPLHF